VARSITNPDRQAQTLATVAEALAARRETRQARHVTAVACAVGRWTMALVPVLSLEPSAVRVLSTAKLFMATDKCSPARNGSSRRTDVVAW
jgi:hypothetical protein